MVRICACDDDPRAMDTLKTFLSRYFQEENEPYTLDCFTEGLDLSDVYTPLWDVLFLDILMEHSNGIDIARAIRRVDADVVIIFLTQTARYAIRGYEVQAFDYMVKPIDYDSFRIRFRRALKEAMAHAEGREEKIEIVTDARRVYIALRDIRYIEVLKHYLTYHTTQGIYVTRGSISDAEKALTGKGFFLCSRYCLVNLRYVRSIEKERLSLGEETLNISRRQYKPVMEAMANYYAGGGSSHV